MASNFWALSVGSGEAFLLRTRHSGRDWTVLVDSGRSGPRRGKHPLVEAIRKADRSISHIDIAVCTHQDADHATGFATFAEWWARKGGSVGEFWLPGRWSAAFPQIITDPLSFLHNLQTGALEATSLLNREDAETKSTTADLGARLRSVAPLDDIARRFQEVASTNGLDHLTEGDDQSRSGPDYFGIQHDLSDSPILEGDGFDDVLLDFSRIVRRGHWYPWVNLGKDSVAQAVFLTLLSHVIDTAIAVRRIAVSALRNSIRVRWFDFGLFEDQQRAMGGYPRFLEPASAVELRRPPPPTPPLMLFFCLALSRQNVESLVIHRVESQDEPGVLFLGDSRLAFGINNPGAAFPAPTRLGGRDYCITAPHHGSRTNDSAYDILAKWGVDVAGYIRNGGHWKSRLDGFKKQPRRRCAYCPNCWQKPLKQLIRLDTAGRDWNWDSANGHHCR